MSSCPLVQAARKRSTGGEEALGEQLTAFATAALLARAANCAALDTLYRLHACRLKRITAAIPHPLLQALVPLLGSPAAPEGGFLRAAVSLSSPAVAALPAPSAAQAAALDAAVDAVAQHCFLPDISWRMHGAASMCADPRAADAAAAAAGGDLAVSAAEAAVPGSPLPDTPASQPTPGPTTPARRSSRIQSNPTTPTPAKVDKRRRPSGAAPQHVAPTPLFALPIDATPPPGHTRDPISDEAVYSAPLHQLQAAALLLVDACAAMHWCVRVAPGHHRAKRRLAALFLAAARPELARVLLAEVLCSPTDHLHFTPESMRPTPCAAAAQPTARAEYPDTSGMPDVAAGLRPEGGPGKHPCEEVSDVKHAARLSRCIVLYVEACRLSGALREAGAVLRWGLATNWGAAVVNLGELGPAAEGLLFADLAAAAAAAVEAAEAPSDTASHHKGVLEAAWQVNTLLGGDAGKWAEVERAVEAAKGLSAAALARLGGRACATGLPLAQQTHFLACAKVCGGS